MPWLSHRQQGLSSYSPGLTALKWGRHGTYFWCIFCLATHDIGMSSPHKTCFSQDNKAVFSQCENRRAHIAQCHAINTSSVHLLGWYSRAITFGYTITFRGILCDLAIAVSGYTAESAAGTVERWQDWHNASSTVSCLLWHSHCRVLENLANMRLEDTPHLLAT